jgi:predicted acylesterase/phospholipase RssA
MNAMNMNAGIPQIFRSYNTREEPAMQGMIWEAARATSATPGLFKPMQIGGQRYIDGGFGHNNPTSLAFEEAKILYPSRAVVLVTSIGSGHPDTIQFPKSLRLTSITNTMKQIATDCEKTHEENMRRFRVIPSAYFRFNVQQGIQGLKPQQWGKSAEVSAHTNVYLGTEIIKSELTAAAKILLSKLSTLVILPTDSW